MCTAQGSAKSKPVKKTDTADMFKQTLVLWWFMNLCTDVVSVENSVLCEYMKTILVAIEEKWWCFGIRLSRTDFKFDWQQRIYNSVSAQCQSFKAVSWWIYRFDHFWWISWETAIGQVWGLPHRPWYSLFTLKK